MLDIKFIVIVLFCFLIYNLFICCIVVFFSVSCLIIMYKFLKCFTPASYSPITTECEDTQSVVQSDHGGIIGRMKSVPIDLARSF